MNQYLRRYLVEILEWKVAHWLANIFWGFLVTWDNNQTNSRGKNHDINHKNKSSYSVLGTGISPAGIKLSDLAMFSKQKTRIFLVANHLKLT